MGKMEMEIACLFHRSPDALRLTKRIDLKLIKGSGPNGRIVQKDVLEFKPAATGGVASATLSASPEKGPHRPANRSHLPR